MYKDLELLCIDESRSIRDVISQIDKNRLGIALVVDGDRRLLGAITDGDVRRAMLANIELSRPASVLLARKAGSRFARPITASVSADPATFVRVMKDNGVVHLPLLDHEGRVVGLVALEEFVRDDTLPLRAVIMAGGRGQRLHPLTEHTPKPMLQIGGQPLMEIIVEQLRDAGIRRLHVATHHNSEKISQHFGDGRKFGVDIAYVNEHRPLGTAGALGLVDAPRETMLVINGDILTQVDFRAMLAFHREHQGDLTVAVRQYQVEVPFGVIESDGALVSGLTEKPQLTFFINAGIYLLEPIVCQYVAADEHLDMPELIQRLLADHRRVISFPVREYWLDIGLPDDYLRAQDDVKTWKVRE